MEHQKPSEIIAETRKRLRAQVKDKFKQDLLCLSKDDAFFLSMMKGSKSDEESIEEMAESHVSGSDVDVRLWLNAILAFLDQKL